MTATETAPLTGRRVSLVPLHDRHLDDLYRIAADDETRPGWPLWGATMHPAEFRQVVWALSSCQFAITRRADRRVIGLVHLAEVDLRNGTGSVAVLIERELWTAGWPFEGVLLLVNYAFDRIGLRKLTMRVPRYNYRRLEGGVDRWFTVEGVHPGRVWSRGEWHDQIVLALHRSAWSRAYALWITGHGSLPEDTDLVKETVS